MEDPGFLNLKLAVQSGSTARCTVNRTFLMGKEHPGWPHIVFHRWLGPEIDRLLGFPGKKSAGSVADTWVCGLL